MTTGTTDKDRFHRRVLEGRAGIFALATTVVILIGGISVILEYGWSEDLMTYFSWSQGSKSGGFDARSNNPTAPPATECVTAPVPGQPRNPPGCLWGREIGTFPNSRTGTPRATSSARRWASAEMSS